MVGIAVAYSLNEFCSKPKKLPPYWISHSRVTVTSIRVRISMDTFESAERLWLGSAGLLLGLGLVCELVYYG